MMSTKQEVIVETFRDKHYAVIYLNRESRANALNGKVNNFSHFNF